MKRKMCWLVMGSLLFSQLQLFAWSEKESRVCCSDPCESCCGSEWSVYADYIYWAPRKCDLDYAMTELSAFGENFFTSDGGSLNSVEPTFHSGFRVGAVKYCTNIDIGARYTYLRTSDSDRTVEAPGAADHIALTRFPVSELVEAASGDFDLDLDIAELEFGYRCCEGCRGSLRIFGGFKYLGLDQVLDAVVFDPVNDDFIRICAAIDLDAYGLYAGVDGDYMFPRFCRCGQLGAFANLSLGGLYGDASSRLSGDFIDQTTRFHDLKQSTKNWIGNLDIGVGLQFVPKWECLNLAAGYEFHGFIGTPGLPRRVGQWATGVPSCVSTGFDGLFVRLAFNRSW